MTVQRINEEIVIRISANIPSDSIQRIIDLMNYKEKTFSSVAKQDEIDVIARNSKSQWWKNNKNKYIK